MAILAGTCVGVLYYKQTNGSWVVGVHNGRTKRTVTSSTPLYLVHVSNRKEFFLKNPKPIIFYKTDAEYRKALLNPPKDGTPFGVRIATKVTSSPEAHGCIAFLEGGSKAHNGVFIMYVAADGRVYTNVDKAIAAIKNSPGGTLTYLHWNLKPLGSGRYKLVQETAAKTNVTNLRLLP